MPVQLSHLLHPDRYDAALQDLRRWRKQVGRNILHWRIKRDLSLFVLARMAGITSIRLERFERGHDEIRPEHLTRLATALDVPFDDLAR